MGKLYRISGEYILCAAIWFDNGNKYEHQPRNVETGIVVCGRRHHNCFATLFATIGLVKDRKEIGLEEREQGFLTSKDRFITREEAAELALYRGQFKNKKEMTEVERSKFLYSENLY